MRDLSKKSSKLTLARVNASCTGEFGETFRCSYECVVRVEAFCWTGIVILMQEYTFVQILGDELRNRVNIGFMSCLCATKAGRMAEDGEYEKKNMAKRRRNSHGCYAISRDVSLLLSS